MYCLSMHHLGSLLKLSWKFFLSSERAIIAILIAINQQASVITKYVYRVANLTNQCQLILWVPTLWYYFINQQTRGLKQIMY